MESPLESPPPSDGDGSILTPKERKLGELLAEGGAGPRANQVPRVLEQALEERGDLSQQEYDSIKAGMSTAAQPRSQAIEGSPNTIAEETEETVGTDGQEPSSPEKEPKRYLSKRELARAARLRAEARIAASEAKRAARRAQKTVAEIEKKLGS